jgi:fatty-acyl-CoA synthase
MGLFDTLTAAKHGSLHWWDGQRFVATPWQEILTNATRMAAGLRGLGVEAGTPVASVLTNSADVVAGILGVWFAGGVLASLPVPARAMSIEDYADQMAAQCAHMSSPVLLLEGRLLEHLRDPLAGRVPLRAWESLAAGRKLQPRPPAEDELAFVQYSSGSTSTPKGCALTSRSIGSQLETLAEMVSAVPGEETVVCWLPLSHDMGVFGCLLFSLAHDFDLALSSPERFMFDPRTWFGDCADFGASLSAGPSSALNVAVRAHRSGKLSGELRLRACVIGAERVGWPVLRSASEAFAPYGLSPSAWMPAYGMAEATLVVTAVGLEEAPSYRCVDYVALADGEIRELEEGAESATLIVSAGRPCSGVEVRTSVASGLSEIKVRSQSLAEGYYRDPVRSAERFVEGELATGDLGFMRDGELFVVGRSDDMVSVAGRKVYAGEIEAAVDRLAPVRSGCSTIIDIGGEDRARLVMLLELKDEAADCRSLASAVSRAARAKAGILLDECIFLKRGALPKTPSGKIQRFRCRQLLVSEDFAPLARVRLRRAERSPVS